MSNFILIPRISPSEKDFRKLISKEDWEKCKTKYAGIFKYQCQGCGYSTINADDCLDLHIVSGDINDLNSIEYIILCRACHTIQHMDTAIERNMVKIVNSCHSQADLIKWGRADKNDFQREIDEHNIMFLKKDIYEYLNELTNNSLPINNKIKVILNDNFDWNCGK